MKRFVSLLMVVVLMLSNTVLAENKYECSEWAKEEITKAEELNLIPEGLMDKDLRENITRAEFAAVSVKLFEKLVGKNVEITEENPFKDTEDEEVIKAYSVGITVGTSETEFSPDGLLVREQAAVMLTRVYKKVALDGWSLNKDSEFSLEYEETKEFVDHKDISEWAVESVYFMAANSIIKGVDGERFAPKNITEEDVASHYANATREQAIIMAVRMSDIEISKLVEYDPDPYRDLVHETPVKADDENVFTVAFIGGSLTAGGVLWINETKKVLEEKMPGKTIVTLNAGKGGTDSEYGAARFMEDVGKFAPDMVVIEFAVNDRGQDEKRSKIYMESMIRQCKKLAKEPIVVFLYAPIPYEEGTKEITDWRNGTVWKEQIAKHYGIKSINVYDYMLNDYKKIKDEKKYETFTDYLKTMYSPSGSGFDVHGGYEKYAEAINEAFNEDYEGIMSPMKKAGVLCTQSKHIVEARYNQIAVTDSKMQYAGKWDYYSASNKFAGDSSTSIGEGHYSYPYFVNGIKQVMKDTAAFGFMTSAAEFCISFTSATAGSAATVYIDGEVKGTMTCQSQYHSMNYKSNWFQLPNDGKEHKVILVVDRPSSSNYIFRFGSVIERFF